MSLSLGWREVADVFSSRKVPNRDFVFVWAFGLEGF